MKRQCQAKQAIRQLIEMLKRKYALALPRHWLAVISVGWKSRSDWSVD